MKRYDDLYDQICSIDNIALAHRKASRGKSRYGEVQTVNTSLEQHLERLRVMLATESFQNSEYEIFRRIEGGKEREIYKLPYYPDRIMHHCVANILGPIWMRIFIRDTYASIKGRGIHDGVRRMKVFLKHREETRYCLKFDIRKFYPSVDHGILKAIVRKKIKCKPTLSLLDKVIDSANGIPIGNYLSQYFGNLYLAYFDHWMKEDVGCMWYARYCDDIVVLHRNKSFLRDVRIKSAEYLWNELKLQMKDNWQIFPTNVRGIDFLGYRFYGSHTLIRKSIARQLKRRVNSIRRGKTGPHAAKSLMSYYGWCKHADSGNLWRSLVTGEVASLLRLGCDGELPRPLMEV